MINVLKNGDGTFMASLKVAAIYTLSIFALFIFLVFGVVIIAASMYEITCENETIPNPFDKVFWEQPVVQYTGLIICPFIQDLTDQQNGSTASHDTTLLVYVALLVLIFYVIQMYIIYRLINNYITRIYVYSIEKSIRPMFYKCGEYNEFIGRINYGTRKIDTLIILVPMMTIYNILLLTVDNSINKTITYTLLAAYPIVYFGIKHLCVTVYKYYKREHYVIEMMRSTPEYDKISVLMGY